MFERVVMGKTQDEVTARIGRPDRVIDSGGATVLVYDDTTTVNPAAPYDVTALVTFDKGKAVAIEYVPLPGGKAPGAKGATALR